MPPEGDKAIIHPGSICESPHVGPGTQVWPFAHVLPGARIGSDCNLCAHVFVENDVIVGDRVTVKSGVQLWDGVRLESDVFVGPNATFTNDPMPRSKMRPESFAVTVVERGASLGANCTILPGIRIGARAMVGAGAVVTRNVPPNAIVVGNPARIVGYVDSHASEPVAAEVVGDSLPEVKVAGVSFHTLVRAVDIRGHLVAADFDLHLPFAPRRTFFVFDVPSKDVRGEHAHKRCEQFLVCVRGEVSCIVDDGVNRQEFRLTRPDVGLYMPARIWGTQYKYSKDAVLAGFASRPYEAEDYVRTYEEYLSLRKP